MVAISAELYRSQPVDSREVEPGFTGQCEGGESTLVVAQDAGDGLIDLNGDGIADSWWKGSQYWSISCVYSRIGWSILNIQFLLVHPTPLPQELGYRWFELGFVHRPILWAIYIKFS